MDRICVRKLLLVCFVSSGFVTGCATVSERNPVPEELVDTAVSPVSDYARKWGDELPEDVDSRTELIRDQLHNSELAAALTNTQNALSLSGGGAKGAFAAGVLKGWSKAGDRPEFLIVTGISTGALIAPFAFLGPDWDDDLEELYTSISTSDLVRRRGLIRGLTSDALADTGPLRELLKEHVDAKMLGEIAKQHNRGRRLLIGTTNIEAQRPVIWNIGQIAAEGTEESAQLVRDVMLASAAIPGVFPPVRISVIANGQNYDELHVDGGVSSQVFLYPAQMELSDFATYVGLEGDLHVYVIRNSILEPQWSEVTPKLGPVLKASINTLVRTQGLGDLYRIYLGAMRDGMEFHLASMPPDFSEVPKEDFDPDYMRALFDRGYEMASKGYPWSPSPPGIEFNLPKSATASAKP